ncbi:MAG: YbhB/YbcL family Raf kinase inhibitor-like protein [Rickettsiales bacterium]|nr:YbhB/YbcL family Raf kinase inhibitor-like protein [Rickettsiales bacterium]
MKRRFAAFILAITVPCTTLAAPVELFVTSRSFGNGEAIPPAFAFCAPDGAGKTTDGGNISPQLSWTGAPKGTLSYAIIAVDPDVPSKFDDANKPGRVISSKFPRQDFYHWVLVDIPAHVNGLAEGVASHGITKSGKPVGETSYGFTLSNDYSKFYKGSYGGYDGPCPPWNDERIHHYHFTVYALDVNSLGLKKDATRKQLQEAISKHAIAQGEWVGTFSNYQASAKAKP